MGRYTVDCVPFNPHDTLPDSHWLSDRHTASTGWADWQSDSQQHKVSLQVAEERRPMRLFLEPPTLPALLEGIGQDAKMPTEEVVCTDCCSLAKRWMDYNERVSERRHHQWRQQAAVSPDLRGCVCLFQINSPCNDVLKDNLWGIKDRHIGSTPTAHPQPLRFLCLILFYSSFYPVTHFRLWFSLIVIWFAFPLLI